MLPLGVLPEFLRLVGMTMPTTQGRWGVGQQSLSDYTGRKIVMLPGEDGKKYPAVELPGGVYKFISPNGGDPFAKKGSLLANDEAKYGAIVSRKVQNGLTTVVYRDGGNGKPLTRQYTGAQNDRGVTVGAPQPGRSASRAAQTTPKLVQGAAKATQGWTGTANPLNGDFDSPIYKAAQRLKKDVVLRPVIDGNMTVARFGSPTGPRKFFGSAKEGGRELSYAAPQVRDYMDNHGDQDPGGYERAAESANEIFGPEGTAYQADTYTPKILKKVQPLLQSRAFAPWVGTVAQALPSVPADLAMLASAPAAIVQKASELDEQYQNAVHKSVSAAIAREAKKSGKSNDPQIVAAGLTDPEKLQKEAHDYSAAFDNNLLETGAGMVPSLGTSQTWVEIAKAKQAGDQKRVNELIDTLPHVAKEYVLKHPTLAAIDFIALGRLARGGAGAIGKVTQSPEAAVVRTVMSPVRAPKGGKAPVAVARPLDPNAPPLPVPKGRPIVEQPATSQGAPAFAGAPSTLQGNGTGGNHEWFTHSVRGSVALRNGDRTTAAASGKQVLTSLAQGKVDNPVQAVLSALPLVHFGEVPIDSTVAAMGRQVEIFKKRGAKARATGDQIGYGQAMAQAQQWSDAQAKLQSATDFSNMHSTLKAGVKQAKATLKAGVTKTGTALKTGAQQTGAALKAGAQQMGTALTPPAFGLDLAPARGLRGISLEGYTNPSKPQPTMFANVLPTSGSNPGQQLPVSHVDPVGTYNLGDKLDLPTYGGEHIIDNPDFGGNIRIVSTTTGQSRTFKPKIMDFLARQPGEEHLSLDDFLAKRIGELHDLALHPTKPVLNIPMLPVDPAKIAAYQQATGFDLTGYTHYLEAERFRHIINGHGVGSNDGLKVRRENLMMIGDMINGKPPLSVQRAPLTQAEQSLVDDAIEAQKTDPTVVIPTFPPSILYKRDIDYNNDPNKPRGLYYIEELQEARKGKIKKLIPQTMYIGGR
jgi:hypothetical protein